jgi:hypothetical protein
VPMKLFGISIRDVLGETRRIVHQKRPIQVRGSVIRGRLVGLTNKAGAHSLGMCRLVLFWMLVVLLACVAGEVDARCPLVKRSAAVRRAFQRQQPCPSTGKLTGACPNWVVDHLYPLCAGGADSLENMLWSPTAEARLKDQWEWKMCRRLCGMTRQERDR